MGNRGVLGLERLSREQQREFWRLAARGKEGDDGEAKLSKGEAEGEHAADDRSTKIAGVDPTRARGRFRGVTRYKRTGRYEAHIWDRGRQKHLGSFAAATDAASAYDKTAIKFRGWDASPLNFPAESYAADDEFRRDLATLTKGEFVAKTCAAGRRDRGCRRAEGPEAAAPRGRPAGKPVPGARAGGCAGPRADAGGPGVRAQAAARAHVGAAGCHRGNLALGVRVRVWRVGVRGGRGQIRQVGVRLALTRPRPLDPSRNVAVDPPIGRHPWAPRRHHGSAPLGEPPTPPRGRPRARPRSSSAASSPRRWRPTFREPRRGVARVGVGERARRAVGCRGGCRGVPTTTVPSRGRTRTRVC